LIQLFSMASKDEGSVGIIAGFMLLLIATASGGALDYSNAISKRISLQDLADASALVAARLGEDATLAEYKDAVQNFFLDSELCKDITCPPPDVSRGDNGSVRVEAAFGVPTFILDVVGVDELPVSVVAEALPPTQFGVDVMMVLDYSGSMKWDDKYISMANAAKDFIDRSAARKGESMRVGIVPFSKYVLTPLSGQYAYDIAGGAVLTGLDIVGCTMNRQYPHSVNADTPNSTVIGSLWPVDSYTTGSASGASSYSDPYAVDIGSIQLQIDGESYDLEYFDLFPQASGSSSPLLNIWSLGGPSYVTAGGHDRLALRWSDAGTPPNSTFENYHPWSDVPTDPLNGYGDATGWDTPANGQLPSDFNTHQLAEALGGSCGNYADKSLWARPLSTEFDKLKDAIDKMEPLGATNIALGLDFGWHYLTENEPFSQAAKTVETDTRKSLVLLSDGTQTVAAHGESGAYNVDSANQNILKTCDAAKLSGIDVYTIAFGIDDDWTRTLLETCSSGEPFYHEPADGAALEKVFDDIFDSISPSKPRISM